MKIITVCGSLRFVKEMMEITEKLELEGNCMLVPIYNPNRPNKDSFSEEEALIQLILKIQKINKITKKLAIYFQQVYNECVNELWIPCGPEIFFGDDVINDKRI